MDIQFMKDYYDLRYEETDGENHFVEETAYQEKQSEQSKLEDQLMEWWAAANLMCGSYTKASCASISTWKKSSSRPFICRELMIGNGC